MKKGVSSVIAVVILISITLILGTMISLWARNYTSRVIEDLEHVSCRDVDFVVGNVCYENLTLDSKEGMIIKFDARNYVFNLTLTGFLVLVSYEGRTVSGYVEEEMGSFDSGRVSSGFIEKMGEIREVGIVPRIKSKKRIYNCKEKESIFVSTEVTPC